jgi:hypothetical protein
MNFASQKKKLKNKTLIQSRLKNKNKRQQQQPKQPLLRKQMVVKEQTILRTKIKIRHLKQVIKSQKMKYQMESNESSGTFSISEHVVSKYTKK